MSFFLAKTDTASDTVVRKLKVNDGAEYIAEDEAYLGRFTQLVLGTFKEVRELTVGVDGTANFEQEGTEFSASFLTRCLDRGIANVDIRHLGMDVYAHQVAHFCLADNLKLDKKHRNLSISLSGRDRVRDIIEPICKVSVGSWLRLIFDAVVVKMYQF